MSGFLSSVLIGVHNGTLGGVHKDVPKAFITCLSRDTLEMLCVLFISSVLFSLVLSLRVSPVSFSSYSLCPPAVLPCPLAATLLVSVSSVTSYVR